MACFARLPEEVRERAKQAYRLWRENPFHPGLRFKPIQGHEGLYSVRVGRGWWALGRLENNTVTWFWIGSSIVSMLLAASLWRTQLRD